DVVAAGDGAPGVRTLVPVLGGAARHGDHRLRRLARAGLHRGEAGQHPGRVVRAGLPGRQVDLDDLAARAVAGVGDPGPDLGERAGGAGRHLDRVVGPVGVGQAVAEAERRGARGLLAGAVAYELALGVLDPAVGGHHVPDRDVLLLLRPGGGQPTAGLL